MNAAQTALNASAHNIANLSATAFRREQVTLASTPGGGVRASPTHASEPGHALETDIVGQLVARNGFLANLAVFRTSDQMMGSLLDMTG